MMKFVTTPRLLKPPRRPKNKSGCDLAFTWTIKPVGRTSSYSTTLSRVSPYWFVKYEYPVESQPASFRDMKVSSVPPPRVNPATPTPLDRPPTTVTLYGVRASYTSSQNSPAPTDTVCVSALYFTWLKRAVEMCTPVVDEKPWFEEWPPPLIYS
jgi:hypothetical protein